MDKKFGYIVIAITIFIFVIFVYGLFRNFIEVSDKLDFTPLKYIVGFVLTLVILVYLFPHIWILINLVLICFMN